MPSQVNTDAATQAGGGHSPAPGSLLPSPPDFPVHFRDAEEQALLWEMDRMHFPDPVPPMTGHILRLFTAGRTEAMRKYAVPLTSHITRFNSYVYGAVVPVMGPEAEEMGRNSEARLGEAVRRLPELWRDEWRPQIEAELRALEAMDPAHAALDGLPALLDELFGRVSHLSRLHFETVLPVYLALGLFEDMCADLFGGEDAFQAHRMLQGLDNLTVDSGRALWALSRRALAMPEVRRVLEIQPAASVSAALAESAAGRAFLAAFDEYLQEHGKVQYRYDVSTPSWLEDPTPAIKLLKDYVGQPDRDWFAERRKLVTEREAAIAAARARLQGYPQPVAAQFEGLLRSAQAAVVASEDHNALIDMRCMYQWRRVLLAIGERLAAAGLIGERDGVFYLTPDEIKDALRSRSDCRAQVAAQKAEMAHFRQIDPPRAIGTVPAGPPPGPPDNPLARAMVIKFFGAPVEQPAQPGVLRGYAGAPGVVRGIARVVCSYAETDRLNRGEILVTETTSPPWTPLFAAASGIVTDTGGVLSHSAVVAREYGIPAVVGTGLATSMIPDGAMIEVDGNTGYVRILETS